MGITYINTQEPPPQPPPTRMWTPPAAPTPAPGHIHGSDSCYLRSWPHILTVLAIGVLVAAFGFAAGHAWALR